jgi:hypothetical protein
MTLVIIVIYWRKYGVGNFLWFSDIALIGAVPALWFEQRLLASMLALSVLLPEVAWNVSYFGQLLTGKRISGLTDYMFEAERPTYLKLLSLFHVPLPPLLLWMVYRMGYDDNALLAQTLLAWVVLPMSFWLTRPFKNVNWVRGPGGEGVVQEWMHPLAWLGVMMLAFPLLWYLPTHFILRAAFG